MKLARPRTVLRLCSAALLVGWIVGVVEAAGQQPGSAGIAPKGELRVALQTFNPTAATRNAKGEYIGVAPDLASALAKTLGAPVKLIPYDNIVRYNQSLGKDEWDIAFTPRDLSRTGQLVFSEPFMEADNAYVARPGFQGRSSDEVDRHGVKVAVAQGTSTDGYLTRTLKSAEIVRLYNGLPAAREALTSGRADVYADYTHVAHRLAADIPGATILLGRFNVARMTIALPKSNAGALKAVNDFIQNAKRDGLITEAIKRAGIDGVHVDAGRPGGPVRN